MKRFYSPLAALVFCLSLPSAVRASCGASSCPLDVGAHERSTPGLFRLDVSLQYINQDEPRAGTHKAAVGAVPNDEHNEVSTLNRIWTARGDYDVNERWGFSVALPLISRAHDHIAVAAGDSEHWDFTGLGDMAALARFTVLPRRSPEDHGVKLVGGLKLPTGATGARNDTEKAEVTIQPGSGSYDLIAGAIYEKNLFTAPGLTGLYSYVPVFVGFTYKENNPGSRRYRFGDELQVNLGGAYSVLSSLELLGQANLRVKLRDYNGDTGEDTSFTGGEFVYLSPGLRWRLREGLSFYGYVQLPVRQRVNQEQLTSGRNWLFGATYAF